jgi:protein ImuB
MRWGKSWRSEKPPEAAPIVITAPVKNAIRLVAVEKTAERYALSCGQTLSDARALVPLLDQVERDQDAVQQLLASIAQWCGRYTPLVALAAGPDPDRHFGLFLDITGCAHLFGGEAAMAQDAVLRLHEQGFTVRAGLADRAGAAWALAHFGPGKKTVGIVPSGGEREAVADLPLAALRIDQETVSGLRRLGLKTIGYLMGLPRAPLAARFGTELLSRLDQAVGKEAESISPILPIPELVAERRFADPLVYEDDIRETICRLAANLAVSLEKRGLGVLACHLALYRVDGEVVSLDVFTANPVCDPIRIRGLFEERLDALHDDFDAGFGFDVMRLGAGETAPLVPMQSSLDGHSNTTDDYHALVDRLGARIGNDRILRVVLADTHIPERRSGFLTVFSKSGKVTAQAEAFAAAPEESVATRPLLLFDRPEPVEVIAQVPEGAPMRFLWRRVGYEVARAEGPERIACEWWQDGRASYTRDYFRVEDRQGYRFWLFRHGLYERETGSPKWYMHGLFA